MNFYFFAGIKEDEKTEVRKDEEKTKDETCSEAQEMTSFEIYLKEIKYVGFCLVKIPAFPIGGSRVML